MTKREEFEEFGFGWVLDEYPDEEEDENMKCAECCYYWQDEDENRPRCHWEMRCPGDLAPCEYEDDEPQDDPDEWYDDPELENGFDPYEGYYTWDC